MTFTSKRFEVRANPWSGVGDPIASNPQLSNLTDRNLPDDDQKLKWMYTQYGKQATFDPTTGQFFPATLNYGQHEIDSAPGDYIGGGSDPFYVPIPRISPIDEGQFGGGSNGCPYGFYQFGKTCVPDAGLNPDGSGSLLGSGGTLGASFYGKGGAKGVINAITPPQFTQPNQEFIVITDMQNIGGTPAKFATQISIPDINISGSTSNSTLVNPLQKMKIGHRIIMPANVSTAQLLNAQVQLINIPLTQSGVATAGTAPVVDDNGKVSIPSPGYRGPLPPMGGGIAGTLQSGVGLFPTPQGGFPQPPTMPPSFGPPNFLGPPIPAAVGGLQLVPTQASYMNGQQVTAIASGFMPGEPVTIQIYSVTNLQGMMQFGTRLYSTNVTASPQGVATKSIPIISSGGNRSAVIAIGNMSGQRQQIIINVGSSGFGINIGLPGIQIGI